MSVVLVTGAGGFVGSAIVRRLVETDTYLWDRSRVERVVAMLRPGGTTERLDEVLEEDEVTVVHADVMSREAVLTVMAELKPRAVVHAALAADVYAREDERLVRVPLKSVLDGLQGTPDARLVLVGSAWILASGERLDERAPLGPTTWYGMNKATEERVLAQRAREVRVPWMTLRLFNLFGRFEHHTRLVPSLVAKLGRGDPVELTQGGQVRDFNDVDVTARAFVNALAAPASACNRVYHIGSGVGTTVRELALSVAHLVGNADADLIRFGASEKLDGGVPVLVADPSLAMRNLGWQLDSEPLNARLREAVHWWLARRPEPSSPHETRA